MQNFHQSCRIYPGQVVKDLRRAMIGRPEGMGGKTDGSGGRYGYRSNEDQVGSRFLDGGVHTVE